MTGNWNNDQAYYRCRFPTQYALANQVDHPKTVYLREADVLSRLDTWLGQTFAPASLDATFDPARRPGLNRYRGHQHPRRSSPSPDRRPGPQDRPVPGQPGRRGRPRRHRPLDR
jgi:hypothetical protein